jgi:hypothetical protein
MQRHEMKQIIIYLHNSFFHRVLFSCENQCVTQAEAAHGAAVRPNREAAAGVTGGGR